VFLGSQDAVEEYVSEKRVGQEGEKAGDAPAELTPPGKVKQVQPDLF
jgi:hypothetical protein